MGLHYSFISKLSCSPPDFNPQTIKFEPLSPLLSLCQGLGLSTDTAPHLHISPVLNLFTYLVPPIPSSVTNTHLPAAGSISMAS